MSMTVTTDTLCQNLYELQRNQETKDRKLKNKGNDPHAYPTHTTIEEGRQDANTIRKTQKCKCAIQ